MNDPFNGRIPHVPDTVYEHYKGRSVLVTGAGGFLGSHVMHLLRLFSALPVAIKSQGYDLTYRNGAERAVAMFKDTCYTGKAPLLFHLAARVSGIHSTSSTPVEHLEDNVLMATNILTAWRSFGYRYVVAAGSVCAYPENTPVPMNEKNLWEGKPEPTNFSYGLSKRYTLALLEACKQQNYLTNFAYLISANLYGPYDNFNPKTSHVIPALITKAIFAKMKGENLKIWGDGSATRDFLYVEDAALAYVLAGSRIDHIPKPLVVNIGSGEEISILWTAREICKRVGLDPYAIEFETHRPTGQQRRSLQLTEAKERIPWEPTTKLREGLDQTLKWYMSQSQSMYSLPITTFTH